MNMISATVEIVTTALTKAWMFSVYFKQKHRIIIKIIHLKILIIRK